MSLLLEEEREGLEGEPARARLSVKLAGISWALHLLLWQTGIPLLKMFAAFALVSAWFWTARAVFHLITLAIISLPAGIQSIVQVLVALIVAAVPLAFLYPHNAALDGRILIQAFEPFTRNVLVWLPMALYVYIVYAIVSGFPTYLEVRRYLILAAVVFLIAYIAGHGGFEGDDEGMSSRISPPDPKSKEGQISMATSYLRLLLLGYATVLATNLNTRVLRRRLVQPISSSR